jgi:AraC-like DNA-binding protein
MNKNAISLNRYGEIASFLGGISQYTYNQFLNLLLYLYFTLTGVCLNLEEAFGFSDTEYQTLVGQQHSSNLYQSREEGILHGTYFFEQRMLELIKSGDADRLNTFLMTAAQTGNNREGKLAETPLRQAKNLFIGLTTMIGKYAAIPGGMDIEQTYQLIDTYIQECEKLQTEEAVKKLQYNMPLDFAQRVAQQKLPDGVSQEIFSCMQYISLHINEPIGIPDVVSYSKKSRAYLFKKFRDELGTGISEYIMSCRLREAKSLLKYTDKPLSEISSYLCFSSQSHFQNTFKKHFNITPLGYREQTFH